MKEYRAFTEKELKWLQRLENLCKKAPETIFLFVGSGNLQFYTKDENNRRYMVSYGGAEGVDDNAPNFSVIVPFENDGGDY